MVLDIFSYSFMCSFIHLFIIQQKSVSPYCVSGIAWSIRDILEVRCGPGPPEAHILGAEAGTSRTDQSEISILKSCGVLVFYQSSQVKTVFPRISSSAQVRVNVDYKR